MWRPTARRKGVVWFSLRNFSAVSVISISGRDPPGWSDTVTGQNTLEWALPSRPGSGLKYLQGYGGEFGKSTQINSTELVVA